jgi:tRNA-2-methylthio-N6-dimethylallyladenosine synthase
MTSHPKDISAPLVDCFADLPELCDHIHLPVQSGSDRILGLMNRGYVRREYLAVVERLRQARPGIRFTSDLIVGFPGETEEEFGETLSLMAEVGFIDSFSFVFSARPETAAAGLDDPVKRPEKIARLERLLALQRDLSRDYHRSLVDSLQEILIEGDGKRSGQLFGRTSSNRIVNLPAPADLVGTLQRVRIVRDYQNSLLGELPGYRRAPGAPHE